MELPLMSGATTTLPPCAGCTVTLANALGRRHVIARPRKILA
jgi:hypothetical protein